MECSYQKDGKTCQAYALLDSEYCFFHDPAAARKRAEARKRGGFNRRVIKRTQHDCYTIKTVKDINTILEFAINEACTLTSSQSQLRTVGYLCQIALRGQELGSLEERICALEEPVDKAKGKR